MPIYIGDSNNKARLATNLYTGVGDKAKRILKVYVGDENNKARIVYDNSTRDFTNLNFKCTFVNDATGGSISTNRVYTSIPVMWNTGADLNTSVTFKSDKLKLRKGDIVKAVFTLSTPANCDNYSISMWLESGNTSMHKEANNTKSGELIWEIKSSLNPINIIINVFGSKANVKLTDCSFYVKCENNTDFVKIL